jgi:hypothetical protein
VLDDPGRAPSSGEEHNIDSKGVEIDEPERAEEKKGYEDD